MGSESVYDFFCGVCDLDGKYLEAMGYCEDCEDYLCQECYNTHLKPRPSRHHVLLDQDHMPKATSQRQNKDMCTEPCAEHKNKILEYYCADHDKFGCSVCMTLYHRNCEGVDYIPDIAGDVLTSGEYKDMNLKLKSLINTAQQTINTAQLKTQTSTKQYSDASEFFKQLKQDLITAVDRIETLTMTNAGKIRDDNQTKMKSVEDQCTQLLKDIGALDSEFTCLENKGQYCQIFFSMKKERDETAALEAHLLQLQDQGNTITEYTVQLSEDFHNFIQQPEKMAALQIKSEPQTHIPPPRPETQQQITQTPTAASTAVRESEEHKKSAAVHVADIGVRIKDDKYGPRITGSVVLPGNKLSAAVHVADIGVRMKDDKYGPRITGSVVLPGDKLVIVDNNNDTVKLINLKGNEIVAHLKYDRGAWGITAVSNTQVVVTCPHDSTILFINVVNRLKTLTLDHNVKVNGKCMGIASFSDKLVITYYNQTKVEIISQKGQLLQTVVTEDRGRQLFTNPHYVAVSPDQQTLYISDSERGTVTSLDLSGQVKAIYKDKELEYPYGLTVDRDGVLYVCGGWSDNIHQLTPDLQKIQILLQQSDGIMCPIYVSYDVKQNKLHIGVDVSDIVKMYKIQ